MAPISTASADHRSAQSPRSAHARDGRVAIVDIGSNSVRLVIYESFTRTPSTVHNEKAICGIGRNMVSSGKLHAEGIAMALEALGRFRMMADALDAQVREAVATAAARDASNGQEFVRRAEAAWGSPIRVLSGEEEARIAAEGVLSGTPEADGLVADLGGGSLDMVTVKNGRTGQALTFPFGPLRLMDIAKDDPDKARKLVDDGLGDLARLGSLEGRSLYAVGGIWRSFARIDMEECNYPLHVLHHYTIPRVRALRLCKVTAHLSRKSIERMKVISRRRAEALPYGAVVLERLLQIGEFKDVVISAYGLREGLLHAQLSEAEREKDPLLEFAVGMNSRLARSPGHAEEMFKWMSPLFANESDELERIRHAVCLFSDIAWRRHPDDRAFGAFNQVLTAPFAGADHRARALIATAIYHRYSGDEDFPRDLKNAGLLHEEDEARAKRLGLAARLGFELSGSAQGELPYYPLRMTPTKIVIEVPPRRSKIAADSVMKRLGGLADAFAKNGEVHIG
ncbi:MAG TPA: Ppx/GppA family phosphatase [Rhizomicrobium sp.]|nr:Ppx/GppA family phosphatase [Rhizomicrobium sp.]